MPRRRVIKVAAAAFVGAVAPGLQTTPAWGRARMRGSRLRAGKTCPPGKVLCGPNFCCDYGQACFEGTYCCPTGGSLCKAGGGQPGEMTCCNANEQCIPAGGCCSKTVKVCGSTCCPGEGDTCADPKTGRCCPKGAENCGSICCPVGGTCANEHIELCCKPRAKACQGRKTVNCCKSGAACCDGHCCGAGKRCVDNKCTKCPPHTTVCGDDHCCERDQKCCGGQCCQPGETCASMGPSRPQTCCPPHRVLKTQKGTACCPANKVARGGACCPGFGPCDTCQDVPCLPGLYCINGACHPLK